MEITWHGLGCLSIEGKTGTVITDPFDAKHAGIKLPKMQADICCANEENSVGHAVDQFGKDVRVFDWPGEYEAKNIIVQAIPGFDRPREKESNKKDDAKRVLVFSMQVDGFRICHLSTIGHKLTPEMIEAIGNVDILIVPVGGMGLDAKKAHEVIEQLDPRIVIPMYYKTPGVNLPLAELDAFLKEVGLHAPAREKSLKYQTPSQLPQEQTEFKILEAVTG